MVSPFARIVGLWLTLVFSTSVSLAESVQGPNIVFLFADDQRADTIAALGNPLIQTPNIDRIVQNGVSFRRAYMQGAMQGATCIPSRAMLLSGRSLARVDETLLHAQTWPEAFRDAGYTTFVSGKWHNGDASISKCFQLARSMFTGGMTNPMRAPLRQMTNGRLEAPVVSQKHACEVFADEAVRFIQNHTGGPFLCYVPFDAPHDPHIVPESFPIKYDPAKIPLPKNFLPEHPFDNGEMKIRDEILLSSPRTPESVRAMIAEYYRYISYLDAQIGKILDALRASPFADNTIVVFSSDSGVARGSHGLIGKQNLYEHSIRVPLILSGPGFPKGKSTEAMCYLFDVFPTLGAVCGVKAPASSEGLNLSSVLLTPSTVGRRTLRFKYKEVQEAVCDQQWKLIRYPSANKLQLFDLNSDPEETHDLADAALHHERVVQMSALLNSEE